jgi:hypothetical protein
LAQQYPPQDNFDLVNFPPQLQPVPNLDVSFSPNQGFNGEEMKQEDNNRKGYDPNQSFGLDA